MYSRPSLAACGRICTRTPHVAGVLGKEVLGLSGADLFKFRLKARGEGKSIHLSVALCFLIDFFLLLLLLNRFKVNGFCRFPLCRHAHLMPIPCSWSQKPCSRNVLLWHALKWCISASWGLNSLGVRQSQGPGSGQVAGEDGGSQRSFTYPLRHPRPMRPRSGNLPQDGLDGQKAVARTSGGGRVDSVSPGRADDSAGPSVSDAVGEPSGDRPHHCLECGKTFRLISSLKKHIRIHTGEKPYPCGVCGRRFRESGALKTHLRIHTGEKPYSCSECGNSFRHLDGLRKHRRTHTGEKPYVCAICGKRLSRLQHLKHHQLIHTGERPCCCPFCNRSFKEPAALRKHVRTHREEGGHMGLGAGDETDPDAMDDINNLHPAAPSPQMRFGEWGAEEDESSVVDCV
uniref:Si:ch1073-224n8.1 n=1 Tax=Myripristis murdjan TaxID=586833 RepID=A0A667WPV0_9TELE